MAILFLYSFLYCQHVCCIAALFCNIVIANSFTEEGLFACSIFDVMAHSLLVIQVNNEGVNYIL